MAETSRIIVHGVKPKEFISLLKSSIVDLNNELEEASKSTRSTMVEYIRSNKRRQPSKNNLENFIRTYKQIRKGAINIYGVGLISILDRFAKYWGIIATGKRRDGSDFIPPKSIGYFDGDKAPNKSMVGTGIGTEIFTNAKNGYFLVPKNKIKAIRYIDAGNDYINDKFRSIVNNFVDKFQKRLNNKGNG